MENLKIFYSTISDGNMNTNKCFYPNEMTKEEIRMDFDIRRCILGRQLDFNGLKILTPIQKSRPNLLGKTEEEQKKLLENYQAKYKDGHYVRITEDMIKDYEDLYDLDIYADILMIDSTLPKIALAYPVADCPVVFAEDMKKGVVSMAHCGGEYIDRELPGQIVDSLQKEEYSRAEDIRITIGAHAQEKSYTYNCFPPFIKNEKYWNDCLNEREGLLHINMSKAIIKQMLTRGIKLENIYVSSLDTITDPRFFSNNAARFDEEKAGRFYTGCFYCKNLVKNKAKNLF